MSMLAERKRKQKWSLNPRGKAWSEDGTKFGQKLLEKMGWQTGKGLGANEDGITEHVKLSYKNDSKGMGYKETDQWTEHESNFTALLESLTGTSTDTAAVELKSLEKKSRASRARLHYRKFTKGKDLSSRSEKDLANIFGRRTLRRAVEEEVPVKVDAMESNRMLINGGSMADYFRNKLSGFARASKRESESEDDVRVGFGFRSSSEDKATSKREFEDSTNVRSISKRKVEDSTNVFSPRKKARSGDSGFANPGFNPLNNRVVVERHSLETILESSLENVNIEETDSVTDLSIQIHNQPKKKTVDSSEHTESPENVTNSSRYEVKLSSKKKKKLKSASKNANSSDRSDRVSESDEHLERAIERAVELEKKKKLAGSEISNFEGGAGLKKKKKSKSFGVDNSNFEDYSMSENGLEVVRNGRVMNHKRKDLQDGIENPNFEDYSLNSSQEDPEVVQNRKSTKQKHRNGQNGIANPNFEDYSFNSSQEDLEVVQNVKSIKQKHRNGQNGIENPNFEDYSLNSSQEDLEVVQNVKSTKQKHKNVQNGIENPNFEDYILNSSQEDPEVAQSAKSTKQKHKNVQNGIENPNFEDYILNSSQEDPEVVQNSTKHKNLQNGIENPSFEDRVRNEPQEVNQSCKSRKSKNNNGIQNPNFNDDNLNGGDIIEKIQSTKSKKKKASENIVLPESTAATKKVKSKKIKGGLDNITFEDQDEHETIPPPDNPYEVKSKDKKKHLKSDVVNDTKEDSNISSDIIDYSDLMLNIVTAPIPSTPQPEPIFVTNPTSSTKRRKSVRFNDVPQHHIIPNNEQLKLMEGGIDNVNFDEVEMHLRENMEKISNTIDRFQAEIENDINEKKVEEIMIGEMDKPDGPNEKLPDGTRLKFRYVEFDKKLPNYFAGNTGPKKSYKHLIKGDIIVKFKNTNLHEIHGYATRKKPRSGV